MHIISFATEESDWSKPRLGILLHKGDRDTGFRLDCERLFDPADRPANPLAWFDMDAQWFQKARPRKHSSAMTMHSRERTRKAGWSGA